MGVNSSEFFSGKLSLTDFSVHFSASLSQHKPDKVRQGQLLKEQLLRKTCPVEKAVLVILDGIDLF